MKVSRAEINLAGTRAQVLSNKIAEKLIQTSAQHDNWSCDTFSFPRKIPSSPETFTKRARTSTFPDLETLSLPFSTLSSFLIPNNIITYCDPKCDMSIDWSEMNARRRMWNALHKTKCSFISYNASAKLHSASLVPRSHFFLTPDSTVEALKWLNNLNCLKNNSISFAKRRECQDFTRTRLTPLVAGVNMLDGN
jgi:hypothetical protein